MYFDSIRITSRTVSSRCSFSKENLWIRSSFRLIFAYDNTATLIISNEETENIMKIVKLLKESGLLIKEICETIKNKGKEEKGGNLPMLLGILAASMCVYVRVRVYVCVFVCVCVFMSIHPEDFICLVLEFQGKNNVVLKTFLSSEKSPLHCYFSMKHQAFLTLF